MTTTTTTTITTIRRAFAWCCMVLRRLLIAIIWQGQKEKEMHRHKLRNTHPTNQKLAPKCIKYKGKGTNKEKTKETNY